MYACCFEATRAAEMLPQSNTEAECAGYPSDVLPTGLDTGVAAQGLAVGRGISVSGGGRSEQQDSMYRGCFAIAPLAPEGTNSGDMGHVRPTAYGDANAFVWFEWSMLVDRRMH